MKQQGGKIGVLFGVENSFPPALAERINAMGVPGITAEAVQVGGVRMAEPAEYTVIVDRISHDLPFYRSYLKNAALTGTHVINNPFWWSADDKFFNYALASKLGVAVPRTVLLPHKEYPPQISANSLRNLEFPLDWGGIFDYVGFPAFLKPHDGGGWRDVHHVHSAEEFFWAYGQTRNLCMTLQAAVKFQEYFRCYVVGQREVRIMPYDPRRPFDQRYLREPLEYAKELLARVERDALTLCRALGYDLNTVEFAVEDGVPYAIDFMNPAPDADLFSVGEENFHWIVGKVAELAVEKARAGRVPAAGMNWSAFLMGTGSTVKASTAGETKGSQAPGISAGAGEPASATPAPMPGKPEKKAGPPVKPSAAPVKAAAKKALQKASRTKAMPPR